MKLRPRRRVRVRLKWFVAAAAASSMLLFLIEMRYFGLTYANSGYFAGTHAGEFIVGHDRTHAPGLVEHGRWPSYWSPHRSTWWLSVSLWPFKAAFFPLFFTAAWLFWKDMRYQIPGLCHTCGYDLSGLPDAACPECGTSQ